MPLKLLLKEQVAFVPIRPYAPYVLHRTQTWHPFPCLQREVQNGGSPKCRMLTHPRIQDCGTGILESRRPYIIWSLWLSGATSIACIHHISSCVPVQCWGLFFLRTPQSLGMRMWEKKNGSDPQQNFIGRRWSRVTDQTKSKNDRHRVTVRLVLAVLRDAEWLDTKWTLDGDLSTWVHPCATV